MAQIITHRGLDPSRPGHPKESSLEAFLNQLKRGYGLEFDLQFTKDREIVINHSPNLASISGGQDERSFADLTESEIVSLSFDGCHLASLETLLAMIDGSDKGGLNAIHLKYSWQSPEYLDIILEKLERAEIDFEHFVMFDVKIEAARYLKKKCPQLSLAPSVAHPFDIQRYNGAVGETLLSFDEVRSNCALFDWVWLDEWDLADEGGRTKKLYTAETFDFFRRLGLKIALVTPELHRTSPGLLGGEAHADAETQERLFTRLAEILSLRPDAVCTDYPDQASSIQKSARP